jgi:light-regulated signal transduction histidine kinase (bacteriophytochrome)
VGAERLPGPVDLTGCDREPIHIPGAIQPHGLLLVADAATLRVIAGAGDLESRLGPDWLGQPLSALLRQDVAALFAGVLPGPHGTVHAAQLEAPSGLLEVELHREGHFVLAELEPAAASPMSAGETLIALDNAAMAFERAPTLQAMCEHAALVFRQITGFDRVMIYRFLDDGAGAVIAEARHPELGAFLNHRFPGTDVPQQARRLYIRNRVRVIPDVHYTPAPLRPAVPEVAALDMSDLVLRSVSPVHLQYMRNMGVDASASISIVKDGLLWGLIACHNRTVRGMTYEARAASRALASNLGRQIRAKEEAEDYRERLRLRGAEDQILARFNEEASLGRLLQEAAPALQEMLGATGFVAVLGEVVATSGRHPTGEALQALIAWIAARRSPEPFRSHELARQLPQAQAYREIGSGLLAVTVAGEPAIAMLWFRAEKVEVVNWAGNPHKDVPVQPGDQLTPRASFEAWRETVHGRADPWSLADLGAVRRLAEGIAGARRRRQLLRLNRELDAAVAERDKLLRQKDFLMREVNHRVQNSLQLVASYLNLQARETGDAAFNGHIAEARRRLSAVSLVHRRLYRDEHVEVVDLSRYLEELCGDLMASLGESWSRQVTVDLAPVLMSAGRAIDLGLIVTELVINASKHAYGGEAGPLEIGLQQHGGRARIVVADRGVGGYQPGKGFGSAMMLAMIDKLDGRLDHADNHPGLRIYVDLPIEGEAGEDPGMAAGE